MLKEATNKIYGVLLGSPFLSCLLSYLQGLHPVTPQHLLPYLKLCEIVQTRTADGWKEVPLDAVKGRIDELADGPLKQSMEAQASLLIEHRDHIRRRTAVAPQDGCLEGESFRKESIVPTAVELHTLNQPELPVNWVHKRFSSVLQYLETHYRLLREDCVAPLRTGIQQYRNNQRGRDIRLYINVKVCGLQCGQSGIEYLLAFSAGTSKAIRWESSKRLMFGSLLCISSDNFENILWATVSNRDTSDLSKGLVSVRLVGDDSQGQFEADMEYVMAESTAAYFEAYSHVLKSLQLPSMNQLPFQSYLVNLETTVSSPSYLAQRAHRDVYNMKKIFPEMKKQLGRSSLRILNDWPAWESTLDPSQWDALRCALTKELAVIQGPPGTGKTFIGLLTMRVLLANLKHSKLQRQPDHLEDHFADLLEDDEVEEQAQSQHSEVGGPILVVCYTNHALDQFLEGIVKYESNIVRIGGRCHSELLKACNLKNRLFEARDQLDVAIHRGETTLLRSTAENLEKQIKEVITQLNLDTLVPEVLHGVATEEQIQNIIEEAAGSNPVEVWLNHFRFSYLHTAAQPSPLALHPGAQSGQFAALQGEEVEEGELADEEDVDEVRDLNEDRQGNVEVGGKEARMLLFRHVPRDQVPAMGQEAGQEAGQEEPAELAPAEATAKAGIVEEGGWIIAQGRRRNTGRGRGRGPAVLEEEEDVEPDVPLEDIIDFPFVWELGMRARRMLHGYWQQEVRSTARQQLEELTRLYEKARKALAEVDYEKQRSLLRRANVVGMTTTAAARHHELLLSLKAEIVVVEEAAEVLESHILVCLSPCVKHLILIGDHQQLRPSVAVYDLARKNHLDVSMFERLMRNGIQSTMLLVQHRMSPQIARLLAPIYPRLQNHKSVEKYPPVRGMQANLFFLDHNVEEDEDSELASKTNIHEAELAVKLCSYLLKQKYSSQQITILTTYTGQLLEIKRRLSKELSASTYLEAQESTADRDRMERTLPRVSSVDNYQGEECDIIILSLVRSNTVQSKDGPGTIGFLNTSNRVCVALSRARLGLYILGNRELLAARSPLWEKVLAELQLQGAVGHELVLQCPNHADTQTRVSKAAHFHQVVDGGCSKPCEVQLECGHACPCRCHPGEHDSIICPKPCLRRREGCEHLCQQRCHGNDSACPPCRMLVERTMPKCNHRERLPCSIPVEDHDCLARCCATMACGHQCPRRCYMECPKQCMKQVLRTLPCGHAATLQCWQDPKTFQCPEPCGDILPGCSHPCAGTCGACKQGLQHQPCQKACDRTLVCGHACISWCAKGCPPCTKRCAKSCFHSRCPKACGAPCNPCRERCVWQCDHHRCELLCHEPCTRPRCDRPCPRTLPRCGHPCVGLCGETCPGKCRVCNPDTLDILTYETMAEAPPEARFLQLEDCHHIFEVSQLDRWMEMDDEVEPALGSVIKLKECPQCRRVIRKTRRYCNIVKKKLAQVEAVKLKLNGFEAVNNGNSLLREGKRKHALRWFKKALNMCPGMPEALYGVACVHCGDSDPQKAVPILKAIVKSSPLADTLSKDAVSVLGLLPAGEGSAPVAEAMAMRALAQLASALTMSGEFRQAIILCDAALELVPGSPNFIEVKQDAERGDRDTAVRVMIEQVGSIGHWYTCPNGHLYTIGECGRPMEESTCPDCKERIGGERHRPTDGNVVVSHSFLNQYVASGGPPQNVRIEGGQ